MHEPCKEAQVSFACLFLDFETEAGEDGVVGGGVFLWVVAEGTLINK